MEIEIGIEIDKLLINFPPYDYRTAVSWERWTKNLANEVFARKEVLLCGGAFGSPTILMRSGIGNENFLQSKGIDCLVNLKGVGENLQDHIDYITSHRVDSWELFGKRWEIVGKCWKMFEMLLTYRTNIRKL